MNMVEETIVSGKKYSFATNPHYPLEMHTDDNDLPSSVAECDWYLAFGGGHNAIISEVSCQDGNGGKEYCAKVKFIGVYYYSLE